MNLNESARLLTRDGQPVALLGVKVMGELRGLIFEAKVSQRFSNPSADHVEVVYTFPLPWGAVLLDVDVWLGDKHLAGSVIEKQRAEMDYEDAIADGNAAIMLQRNHDQTYSLNLGNLAPQEACNITLRYAQTLQFEQRGLRLLIPTVIAPRYGDAVLDGGLSPHLVPAHSLLADYPFEIELNLHGELAHARVASPSHPIAVTPVNPDSGGALKVSLARRGSLDRDFVLIVDQLAHDSQVVIANDYVQSDAVAVLASFCPRINAEGPAKASIKMLVDCSGSMAGDSIDAAKRALHSIVKHLNEGDRFSLSRFGSSVEHRSRGLWKVTEATRHAAQRWIADLNADLGGTEMESALTSTFGLAQTAGSDVLIVTDGEIHAIDGTIAAAVASGHRLFVVGIGSSPAESHLRRMADATGGACDFVAPGEAVEPAVLRMFARLRSPRLTNVAVVWPFGVTPLWTSTIAPSVFDGDTVNVFALLPRRTTEATGDVCLVGQKPEDAIAMEIGRATLGIEVQSEDTVSRLAASVRLHRLETTQRTSLISEAAQLAVAYQLVTEHTNFLLVHERVEAEKATDMPMLLAVEHMVPAGWGGTGTIVFSRRDAVPSTTYDAPNTVMGSPRCDDLAMPTFARRVTENPRNYRVPDMAEVPTWNRPRASAIPRKDPRLWSKSEYYTGLTPLGLSQWLRGRPTSQWPTTYSTLRKSGLGAWVVDWLELSVARRDGACRDESAVVRAFVYLMSRRDTRESLEKSLGLLKSIQTTVAQIKQLIAGDKADACHDFPHVDAALVEIVRSALVGMTALDWPDDVFSISGTAVDAGSNL